MSNLQDYKVSFTLEEVTVELVLVHSEHTCLCCWSHCFPYCQSSAQTGHCVLGNSVEGSEAWHNSKELSEHLVAMPEQTVKRSLIPERKKRSDETRSSNHRLKSFMRSHTHLQLTVVLFRMVCTSSCASVNRRHMFMQGRQRQVKFC